MIVSSKWMHTIHSHRRVRGCFLSACVLELALIIDIVDSDFLKGLETVVDSEHVE